MESATLTQSITGSSGDGALPDAVPDVPSANVVRKPRMFNVFWQKEGFEDQKLVYCDVEVKKEMTFAEAADVAWLYVLDEYFYEHCFAITHEHARISGQLHTAYSYIYITTSFGSFTIVEDLHPLAEKLRRIACNLYTVLPHEKQLAGFVDEEDRPPMKRWPWWEILDVPQDADQDTIRRAYRRKAKELHPDRGGRKEGFHVLSEALTAAMTHIMRQAAKMGGQA